KQYKSLSQITNAMHLRRKIENNVTVYDSLAIKKVYMNFNQREIIGNLIDEMIKGVSPESKYIKDILIATGSEEVAMALSDIISHPIRQVRQTALKILGELGHASLEVFSRILIDDEMFEREEGRRELSDNKWYIIRNSIFVFGLLKDEKAAIPLRLRINDPDVRVRREIISALERIGGEESVDILMMMAGDADKEIRESAVITIGLIGNPETAPLLISLAKTDYRICLKAINALGRIGGNEAKAFLSETLSDEDKIRELASGELSREDLKLAIVRSLGTLGDTGAIKIIKEFNENLSTTQKLFFKNSQVNKAIKEILSKK
ncbi:MAG: HEAT repeat domain-containing protein, partial [Calditrichaeota bacterium]